MRLFVALDIRDDVRERISKFVADMSLLAPDARWMPPQSWHVTLAFLGERSDESLHPLNHALAEIRCDEIRLAIRNCGFFPNAKSARVFWAGIEAVPTLAKLATVVRQAAGMEMTKGDDYHPHLTLARAGGGRVSGAPGSLASDRSNQRFARLRAELANMPPPDFGSMIARDFYLYRSHLSTHGSNYEKLERYRLAPLTTMPEIL